MSKQDGRGRQVSVTAPHGEAGATILHVDMDAFYASVELLERPELRGRPVIVGHRSSRSVVTAATYEARRFGVNSAMPMALALRRCPQAVVLEPHFDRYQAASRRVMELLGEVTPALEPLSIDEAFLDVAGARRLLGGPFAIGTRIRERVHAETGLDCSVGAAATKFVAKLASSRSKPDGLLVVPPADTVAFLHPLPVSALWGVGGRTEEQLSRLGLRTIGDLAETPVETLRSVIGDAGAARLHELAWGRDPRSVETSREEKSIGHETTFEHDVVDREQLHRELLRLADGVGARLRRAGVTARTVVLKLRFEDFTTVTRSRTLAEPTDLGRRLAEEARSLYDQAAQGGRPVRLIGVRAEQLGGEVAALGLWDEDEQWRESEQLVDQVAARFGAAAVQPASLIGRGSRRRMPIQ
ncbi:DNA polymerase IV [Homoserinibacter sp. YIM 151385]|uniref:DNA polymerase IV n=1 Tax=Homoserinibacter sp. YIM 151385 TaxID=2985506 RepID=UPI0022F0DAE0|nr:DNA polymerase IV [Homoserinibacter sp. YIM 151385]WBU38565.1 DNA polymerase IV [Homoserinibacter sp. YIM 151385]